MGFLAAVNLEQGFANHNPRAKSHRPLILQVKQHTATRSCSHWASACPPAAARQLVVILATAWPTKPQTRTVCVLHPAPQFCQSLVIDQRILIFSIGREVEGNPVRVMGRDSLSVTNGARKATVKQTGSFCRPSSARPGFSSRHQWTVSLCGHWGA